jgi:hypothetical protein
MVTNRRLVMPELFFLATNKESCVYGDHGSGYSNGCDFYDSYSHGYGYSDHHGRGYGDGYGYRDGWGFGDGCGDGVSYYGW